LKLISLAALTALLTISASPTLKAQTPPEKAKDPTKVYAYKKQAAPTNPSGNTNLRQQKPFEHLPESVPFATPSWWQEMGRKSGGADGGG
jgi:hypothetical protein